MQTKNVVLSLQSIAILHELAYKTGIFPQFVSLPAREHQVSPVRNKRDNSLQMHCAITLCLCQRRSVCCSSAIAPAHASNHVFLDQVLIIDSNNHNTFPSHATGLMKQPNDGSR